MVMVFLDPGQLTARLILEAPVDEGDGQGGAARSWNEIGAFWAKIEPVSAGVVEQAGAETGTVTHRIWLRHRSGIAAGQRLRKGARLFRVKLVRDPDETRRYLVCQCEEDAR